MTDFERSDTPESAYNVLPSDYASHIALAREHNLVLWENHGWGVRSIEGDGDTLLWAAAYQLRSRGKVPFVRPEFSALQSMVAHVEYTSEERSRMNDNDFIALGWNGMDDLRPPGDLSVDVNEDRAVWSIEPARFTASPPVWEVQGGQGVLGYNIRLNAESPAFWLTDRKLSALQHGDRWHLVNAKASGHVSIADKRIELDGMGWHERHIHLNDFYDPVKLLKGPGIVFHNGYSPELDFHMMGRPKLGILRAKLLVDGNEINFSGPGEVSTEETTYWIDPKSRLNTPCRWVVRCENAQARFTMEVGSFARTFYLWSFLSGGVNVLYWWLAESTGRLEQPGRAPLEFKGMKHVVHQNQAFFHYS